MKPSRLQRFFASSWPQGIWLSSTAAGTCVFCFAAAGFNVSSLGDWHVAVLYLLLTPVALALGFMLGLFPGRMLFGPLYYRREIVNGGPFVVGDKVQIIGGICDGTVTRIYSKWQGNSVRVELGEEAQKEFKDIFVPTQLLKIGQ